MMTLIRNKVKTAAALSFGALLLTMSACKKGTFDINSPNPNAPSPATVPVKYSLSAALAGTATYMLGGNQDMFTGWMGYWSQSGDYTPSPTYVLYQLNSDTYSGNWDNGYLNLENYQVIINHATTDSTVGNYVAVAMIMKAFVYQRIVDIYNDAPYSDALTLKNFVPKYDAAPAIYTSLVNQIDSAVTMLKNPSLIAASLDGDYDVMFGGDTDMWIKFANTLKLKILMRQTQTSGGDAMIKSALSGYTADDFLGSGENGSVNPGYSQASDAQQSPMYQDIGYTVAGAQAGDNIYFRANTYAVNFYNDNGDTFRLKQIYEVKADGNVYGKQYGSNLLGEHNSNISGVNGKGVVKSPSQDAIILPAMESLFLVAEAQYRGYIGGDPADTYKLAVEESFKTLGLTAGQADTYMAQTNSIANYALATDKLNTIIVQKWAALNPFDALESYSDWRRLGIPKDLPVSVYPGNTATHVPYRLYYPTSESSYNSTNVPSGVDPMTSKIFWMP